MNNFILGCFFIIIFPILDGLVELILQAIQLIKAILATKTVKYNQILAKANEQEEQSKHHYGFISYADQQPDLLEEQEDDDQDDNE